MLRTHMFLQGAELSCKSTQRGHRKQPGAKGKPQKEVIKNSDPSHRPLWKVRLHDGQGGPHQKLEGLSRWYTLLLQGRAGLTPGEGERVGKMEAPSA